MVRSAATGLWALRSRARALMLLCALCGALGATTLISSHASASYSFCTGWLNGRDHCDGSYTHLTATQAHGNIHVCAAAVQSGSFYGSYACGYQFAEHCYGNETLAPRIHDQEDIGQVMHGDAFHDGEVCP
jgi:hypothetical protein